MLAWHVADKQESIGESRRSDDYQCRSRARTGRVAGQAILKDVGRQMLERTYLNMTAAGSTKPVPTLTVAPSAPTPAQPVATPQHTTSATSFSPGLLAAFGVLAFGI